MTSEMPVSVVDLREARDRQRLAFAGEDVPRLVQDSMRRFSLELATWFMRLPGLPGESTPEQTWINKLCSVMRDRDFVTETACLVVALCRENGLTYRLNGRHICQALLTVNNRELDLRNIRVLLYHVNTLAGVRRLYGQLDSGRLRTEKDKAAVYCQGFFERFAVPEAQTEFALATTKTLYRCWNGSPATNIEEALDCVATNATAAENILNLCVKHNWFTRPRAAHMRDQAVIAGICLLSHNPWRLFTAFWNAVVVGPANLAEADPRRVLREWLVSRRGTETKARLKAAIEPRSYGPVSRRIEAGWLDWLTYRRTRSESELPTDQDDLAEAEEDMSETEEDMFETEDIPETGVNTELLTANDEDA